VFLGCGVAGRNLTDRIYAARDPDVGFIRRQFSGGSADVDRADDGAAGRFDLTHRIIVVVRDPDVGSIRGHTYGLAADGDRADDGAAGRLDLTDRTAAGIVAPVRDPDVGSIRGHAAEDPADVDRAGDPCGRRGHADAACRYGYRREQHPGQSGCTCS